MPNYPSPFPLPLKERVETEHHVVQELTRASTAPGRVETPDDMMALRAETIEHLDFEPEVVCASRLHDGLPGAWYWRAHCTVEPLCERCDRLQIEQLAALAGRVQRTRCRICGAHGLSLSEIIKRLGPVR